MEQGHGTRISILSMIFAWISVYTSKLADDPFWANLMFILGMLATITAVVSGAAAAWYYYHKTRSIKKDNYDE